MHISRSQMVQINQRLFLLLHLWSSSASSPFTLCAAHGIHEELSSVAISSYPLDLIP
jgi:hypothetical protein